MKIMTLVINSAYPLHYSAIDLLALRDIQLNIIQNNSPYVLATTGRPNIVIHPLSKVMTDEFPTIKFCGPDCQFPNFNYVPEMGFSELGSVRAPTTIQNKIVFINNLGDTAFIKYLESLGGHLEIYGKKCSSLYYYGPHDFDSYDIYKNARYIAVDSEEEVLKALFSTRINKNVGQTILSNFNYKSCTNFRNRDVVPELFTDSFLESKNWNNIFNNLLKEIGIDNG